MTREPATILIVDDEPANRKLLKVLLRPEGYHTVTASSGEDALACIAQHPPDLILLDIMMPGMDGYEVADRLKGDRATSHIPIIMLSAHSERSARLEGLRAGAEDFLSKPVDRAELWLRVRNLLRLKELSDLLQSQSVLLEEQVRQRNAELQHLAHYDSLTGLPNRALFRETLDRTVTAAGDGASVAVLLLDVDHFKAVNDAYGHAVGDEVLRQLSVRLSDCTHFGDTIGRFGGDEFALILRLERGASGAAMVADKVTAAVRMPFDVLSHRVSVTVSIGVTVYPQDASEPTALMQCADTAMYRAKQAGRDAIRFFTAQMNAEASAHRELLTALRLAVENDEFVLHYQPKVHLSSGKVVGAEALLRWQRPGHGLVAPAEFIPALEETGLIVGVGSWVINEACRQVGQWSRSSVGPVQVSVNVSAHQFTEGHLESDVVTALSAHQVAANLLELELTESSLMANTEQSIGCLYALKRLGVQISVDDFGTGYSSLTYLRRFPIDKLKIDRSFVRDITTDPDDAIIALTIIRMAHSLKLDVIAEGVETEAQLAYLRQHRCDQMQGYLFSRPLTALDMARLLLEGTSLASEEVVGAPPETLLLVDSDRSALARLENLVRGDGYYVLQARSTEEAFALLARHPVHVVVCEQSLPALLGTDFLARVKDLHPAALRILLSASADTDTVIAAVNRGAIHRYYSKPWEDVALREALRDAFRQHWLIQAPPAEQRPAGPRPRIASARTPLDV